MTLPAFAAERRRPQHDAHSHQAIFPACRALSSKPTGRRCCCRSTRQTDGHGRTDARSLHRPCSAYYESSVGNNYTSINVDCEKILEKQKNITHYTAVATPTAVTGVASYGVQGHVTPSTSNFQQHLQLTAILQDCRNINTSVHT